MFNKIDYVIVNVSEMGRSVAFYRDTLGLSLKFESAGWSEFQTGATTLALHPGVPRRVEAGAGPAAGTCSLGFSVERLDATYAELKARGAYFVMAPTDQANEGIRLAVCIDPDGLPISFAESIVREASSSE